MLASSIGTGDAVERALSVTRTANARRRPRVRLGVDAAGRSLGDRVAARRRAFGMSRRELAERAHVSRRVVSNVESETNGLHAYTLAALADALETTMDALWHGEIDRSARNDQNG